MRLRDKTKLSITTISINGLIKIPHTPPLKKGGKERLSDLEKESVIAGLITNKNRH